MNRAYLIGNLTKDPQLKQAQSGLAVCTFSIGVSRRFANKQGERESDFFNIVVWRKQAKNCAKYLRKGSKVCIAGSIQNRSYEAKDGTKRYIVEIVAEEVEFLNGSNNKKTQHDTAPDGTYMREIDADMPF